MVRPLENGEDALLVPSIKLPRARGHKTSEDCHPWKISRVQILFNLENEKERDGVDWSSRNYKKLLLLSAAI